MIEKLAALIQKLMTALFVATGVATTLTVGAALTQEDATPAPPQKDVVGTAAPKIESPHRPIPPNGMAAEQDTSSNTTTVSGTGIVQK